MILLSMIMHRLIAVSSLHGKSVKREADDKKYLMLQESKNEF